MESTVFCLGVICFLEIVFLLIINGEITLVWVEFTSPSHLTLFPTELCYLYNIDFHLIAYSLKPNLKKYLWQTSVSYGGPEGQNTRTFEKTQNYRKHNITDNKTTFLKNIS